MDGVRGGEGFSYRQIPGGSSEMYLFFIRASAVALLFHSSIEGWDLARTTIRRGLSHPAFPSSWHDPFSAADARLDITALAARTEEPTGSKSRVVVLTNLTEGSKRISLEIPGLSPGGRYSVTVTRTNETTLGRTASYVDLDGDPFETFEYKGHPVDADAQTPPSPVMYYTLTEPAVSTALSEVRVVSQYEKYADPRRGDLTLDVEFPNDYGVMKIEVDDASTEQQASDSSRADARGGASDLSGADPEGSGGADQSDRKFDE